MIETLLEPTINRIFEARIVIGHGHLSLATINSTIERLMAHDRDVSGVQMETSDILVKSPIPDSPHYDIYVKVGSVYAPHMGKGADFVPRGTKKPARKIRVGDII